MDVIREPFLLCFDHQAPNYNPDVIIDSVQNTLVCIEMLLMSVAGGIAYTYDDFKDGQVQVG